MRYAALFATFLLGCTILQVARAPHIADCDGPLLPAAEIPGGDFRLRERVRFEGGGVDLGLELLAERRGDRLVLIGFNGFGARVFSAVQQGTVVESDSSLGRALEIPPGNVLRDLHAARFFHPESGERTVVQRSGCGYTATFVRVERRPLR